MSVKERIKVFAKSQEKSVRAFEVKCGFTIGYVNAIRVSIQPDKIQSIASNYPNLNIDWLLTGKDPMLKFPAFKDEEFEADTAPNSKIAALQKENDELKKWLGDKDDLIKMLKEKVANYEHPVIFEPKKQAAKQTGS